MEGGAAAPSVGQHAGSLPVPDDGDDQTGTLRIVDVCAFYFVLSSS